MELKIYPDVFLLESRSSPRSESHNPARSTSYPEKIRRADLVVLSEVPENPLYCLSITQLSMPGFDIYLPTTPTTYAMSGLVQIMSIKLPIAEV